MFTNLQFQKEVNSSEYLYFHLHKVLIKTNLRLLNAEVTSVYLKVSVVKKMRHFKRFSIGLINFISKSSAK